MSQYYRKFGMSGSYLSFNFRTVLPIGGPGKEDNRPLIFKSRADSPSYGSGPYFKAVKEPDTFYVDVGTPPDLSGDQYKITYKDAAKTKVKYAGFAITYGGMYLYAMSNHVDYMWSIEGGYYVPDGDYAQWWTWSKSGNGTLYNGSFAPLLDKVLSYQYLAKKSYSVRIWRNGVLIDSVTYGGYWAANGGQFNYKNRELMSFYNIAELGIYLNGTASRFSRAYVDAWENLPAASCNAMANIAEAITTLKGIVEAVGNPAEALAELAKNLADPRNDWLTYRYVFTTTKLDIEEYASVIRRLRDLRAMSKDVVIRVDGSYSDETGSYHCVAKLPVSQLIPSSLDDLLFKAGLRLNATNLWDMVPFSFVVDWFFRLSDVFSWLENWTYSADMSPSEVWYTYMSNYDKQSVFYRVRGKRLSVPPVYETKEVSGRTVKLRIADTISLFT